MSAGSQTRLERRRTCLTAFKTRWSRTLTTRAYYVLRSSSSTDSVFREGTGTWSLAEASQRHISSPTIAAAHFLRLASADRAQRLTVNEMLGNDIGGAKTQHLSDADRDAFVKDLKDAIYCTFLAAFAQGLNLIARASDDEEWGVKLNECIHIWRGGCIIRAAHIADLLQPLLEKDPGCRNLLALKPVAEEIRRTWPALKRVVARGIEWDAHMSVAILLCLR
jgi:6-phosphogluconate dehydrogenase